MLRSSAVVVRTEGARTELLRRGVRAENILSFPAHCPRARLRMYPISPARSMGQKLQIFSPLDAGTEWQEWPSKLLNALKQAHTQAPALSLVIETDHRRRAKRVADGRRTRM